MTPSSTGAEARWQIVMPADVSRSLTDALQSFTDGLLLMDRDWRITYANERGRQISRLRPEDLHGPTHWELFPTTVGTELERLYRRVMDEGVSGEMEVYYEPFAVWLNVRAFPAGDGVAVHYSDITGLKAAQIERESAARRMREVLDATTDAVFIVDRNWIITYVNRAAETLTAAAGQVVGEGLYHAFPGTVYPGSPYVRNYFAAMNEGMTCYFEASYGEPLHVEIAIQVMPADEGIIIFARDVTQQRNDERAIRASEEKYRILTELGPQAIWTGSPDGAITYANRRFLEYLGNFEITGDLRWLDAFDATDRDRVLEAWSESVRTGEVYEIEARMLRGSDGESRWWKLQALPLRDVHGTITQWLGVANDIHDAKVARAVLEQQQAETERQRRELQAIYDTAPVGLALFEPREFRYLQVNRRQAETLGRPVHEVLGRRISEMVTSPEVLALLGSVAGGGVVRDHVYRTELKTKPGEARFFNVNYSPVLDDAGQVRAISAAVLDITQQKLAEAALLQSEKLAAVGRLAASISHEINNPLEAITNLIYLTQGDRLMSDESRSYLRLAQDELRRVSQIATQTLRFHRQADRPSAVNAAQLVDPVLSLYSGRLINSGIEVHAGYATARLMLCFENDIRQVLNNLIANAIDAMRSGGRLSIRAHDARDFRSGTAGVRIVVADNGTGMQAAVMQRVFEPFYTTKGMNGNGLGLWISKGIVERHQGHLHVRSSQAPSCRGTVFTLFLPSA